MANTTGFYSDLFGDGRNGRMVTGMKKEDCRSSPQTVKEVPEVWSGRSPPIVNPKPAAYIAAQSRPSVGIGLRLCGALCAVLEPRFALLTLPVVSEPLRSKGFQKKAVARRLPPGEP